MKLFSRDGVFCFGSFLAGTVIGGALLWSITRMLLDDQTLPEIPSKMEFLHHTLADGVQISIQYDFVQAAAPGYGRPVIEITREKFRFRFNPPVLDLAYCDDPSELKVAIKSSNATSVEIEMVRNNGIAHQFRLNGRGLIVDD